MSLKIQRPVGLFSGKNDLVLLHLVSSCRQPEVQKPISFFPLHTPSFLRFNEFSKLNPSGHFGQGLTHNITGPLQFEAPMDEYIAKMRSTRLFRRAMEAVSMDRRNQEEGSILAKFTTVGRRRCLI